MPSRELVTSQDRDKLIDRINRDPAFRKKLKENWKEAFKEVGIDPAEIAGRKMIENSTVPFKGGPQMAGITVEIVIAAERGLEQIDMNDSVVFDSKKT